MSLCAFALATGNDKPEHEYACNVYGQQGCVFSLNSDPHRDSAGNYAACSFQETSFMSRVKGPSSFRLALLTGNVNVCEHLGILFGVFCSLLGNYSLKDSCLSLKIQHLLSLTFIITHCLARNPLPLTKQGKHEDKQSKLDT